MEVGSDLDLLGLQRRTTWVMRDNRNCNGQVRGLQNLHRPLHRLLRRKGEEKLEQQRELYQRLVQTTEEVVQQTERVSQALVSLGADALHQIVSEQQSEQVRCEFCATEYAFGPQELVHLLHEALATE